MARVVTYNVVTGESMAAAFCDSEFPPLPFTRRT